MSENHAHTQKKSRLKVSLLGDMNIINHCIHVTTIKLFEQKNGNKRKDHISPHWAMTMGSLGLLFGPVGTFCNTCLKKEVK